MGTRLGKRTSVQVSKCGLVPSGETNLEATAGDAVQLFNNTANDLAVQMMPVDNDSYITMTIPAYSWSAVIVKKTKAVTANTLVWGV